MNLGELSRVELLNDNVDGAKAIAAEPPPLTDRVLVVSHSPEVQELCDERIEVGNG